MKPLLIEQARAIIKKRLFTTTKDYNNLPDHYEILESVAKENRERLSPAQIEKEVLHRKKKLEKAQDKVIKRMSLGRSRGHSAGALNRDIHNLGFEVDSIKHEISVLESLVTASKSGGD